MPILRSDAQIIVEFARKFLSLAESNSHDTYLEKMVPDGNVLKRYLYAVIELFFPNFGSKTIDSIMKFDKRGSTRFALSIRKKSDFVYFLFGLGVGGLQFYRLDRNDVVALISFLERNSPKLEHDIAARPRV